MVDLGLDLLTSSPNAAVRSRRSKGRNEGKSSPFLESPFSSPAHPTPTTSFYQTSGSQAFQGKSDFPYLSIPTFPLLNPPPANPWLPALSLVAASLPHTGAQGHLLTFRGRVCFLHSSLQRLRGAGLDNGSQPLRWRGGGRERGATPPGSRPNNPGHPPAPTRSQTRINENKHPSWTAGSQEVNVNAGVGDLEALFPCNPLQPMAPAPKLAPGMTSSDLANVREAGFEREKS